MKFITLNFSSNGLPLQVNATSIAMAYTNSSGQTVAGINGATYNVKESPEEILALINPESCIPESLVLKEGRRYVRRDGAITEPIIKTGDEFGVIPGSSLWYGDGRTNKQKEYSDDLVSEYVESVPESGIPNPEEPKPLVLEAGKRYVRRDGQTTGPLCSRESTSYPFEDRTLRNLYSYTSSGRYDEDEDGDWDLVSEYVEPLKLEVGKRYVRRDGNITGVIKLSGFNSKFPFEDPGTIRLYSDSGVTMNWGMPNADLVSEYVEPAPVPLILEAGKRYIRRDGLLSPVITKGERWYTDGRNDYDVRGRADKEYERDYDLVSLAPRIYAVDTETLAPITLP